MAREENDGLHFILPEDDSLDPYGFKQHINLSNSAWSIIEQDMQNFALTDVLPLSKFMNKVFANFYADAKASISRRLEEREEELDITLGINEVKNKKTSLFDERAEKLIDETKEECKKELLARYEEELCTLAKSYPKGKGRKFRINKNNKDTLTESLDGKYYDIYHVGRYLKAVFEEYCALPNHIREQIYFKETVQTIKWAIEMRHKLQIVTAAQYDIRQKVSVAKKYIVAPYKIVQDNCMSFNYLACYSSEILPDGTLRDEKIVSYRMNRIEKASERLSKSANLSEAQKVEIEKEIAEKGIQFLAGDLVVIRIKFTKKGLDLFNRQIYMRPPYKKESQDVYVFTCTERQAINYFFKFGIDAQVLEPQSLRERFAKSYQLALSQYL